MPPSARDRAQWLAVLAGAMLYFAVTRGAVLDPRNTGWLLLHIDSGTGYLGWEFFRRAPFLQWPFGANPAYGEAIASSVVFSDSIPLLAFLLKPFHALLPERFQYFGAWLLACFVLQTLFGYRLLRRFSPHPGLALAGSLLFAIAPVWIYRTLGHLALAGQWLLLAALCLYLRPRFSPGQWLALLATASLVHFYLLVMGGCVWAADLWQRRWRGELSWPALAGGFAATTAALAVLMGFAGYFMIADPVAVGGFGRYRMNLLGPIDPNEGWSQVLPDLPGSRGEVEGFNYLGIGVLALGALVAVALLRNPRRIVLERSVVLPLVCVSVMLLLLALSNRVALGRIELFSYPVPQAHADVLRSSGRLFWPVVYLLYLAVLVLVFRLFAVRTAALLCVAAFGVQSIDSASALTAFRWQFVATPGWSSPLRAPLWNELGKHYRHIAYVLPRNAADTYAPWALLALRHGMSLNFGYFARVDSARLSSARLGIERAAMGYQLEPDTLYVFENRALWRLAAGQEKSDDIVGILDQVRIIAPGLKACGACDLRGLRDMWREKLGTFTLGRRIPLTAEGAAIEGWSMTEEWDSVARTSVTWLAFTLPQPPAGDLRLSLESPSGQPLDVRVNGVPLAASVDPFRVVLPRAAVASGNGRILVELRRRGGFAPESDGQPPGLGLTSVTLSGV